MTGRRFPIMHGKNITSIPWGVIAPHEEQAKRNHQQSLDELASRGGLDCYEAVCVLTDRRWRDVPMKGAEYHEAELMDLLKRGHFGNEPPGGGEGGCRC